MGKEIPIEEMTVYQKLQKIQQELKAPKTQTTKFYNYRSCEDILEALKPLCEKYKTAIILNDNIEMIGDRYYVKATALLMDCNGDGDIESSAYAREQKASKSGSDEAQITGAASSYARKYALNGLFAIDDTKDNDYIEPEEEKPKSSNKQKEKTQEQKAKEEPAKEEQNNKPKVNKVENNSLSSDNKGKINAAIKECAFKTNIKATEVTEYIVSKVGLLSNVTDNDVDKVLKYLEEFKERKGAA